MKSAFGSFEFNMRLYVGFMTGVALMAVLNSGSYIYFDMIRHTERPRLLDMGLLYGLVSVALSFTMQLLKILHKELEDLRKKLTGKNFEQLARENSTEPGASESGGDLGFFRRGQMVPAFEEVAFRSRTGEISDIIELAGDNQFSCFVDKPSFLTLFHLSQPVFKSVCF